MYGLRKCQKVRKKGSKLILFLNSDSFANKNKIIIPADKKSRFFCRVHYRICEANSGIEPSHFLIFIESFFIGIFLLLVILYLQN